MPAKSQQQFRLMMAAKEGKVQGIDPKVGAEFTDFAKGHPGSVKQLPRKIALKRKKD